MERTSREPYDQFWVFRSSSADVQRMGCVKARAEAGRPIRKQRKKGAHGRSRTAESLYLDPVYHFRVPPAPRREKTGSRGVEERDFLLVLTYDHQRAQNPNETLGHGAGSTARDCVVGLEQPHVGPSPCPVRWLTLG